MHGINYVGTSLLMETRLVEIEFGGVIEARYSIIFGLNGMA